MNLEEVKKEGVSCIYRINFPDGKCYVGQTVDLGDRVKLYERCMSMQTRGRVSDALREFGIENVSWDVLRAVSVDDKDDLRLCLSILEIKYIRENDCIFPKGYNASIGGEVLNIPAEVIDMKFGVEAGGYASKPVLVYDADGTFVSEHPSVARCAYDLGCSENEVSYCLGKSSLVRGSYMVREKRYGYVPERIAPYEPKVSVRHRTKTEYDVVKEKVYKKVEIKNAAIMYDRDGNYVGLFDNAFRARHFLRLDNDYRFGCETCGMFVFHYNGGEIRKSIGKIASRFVKTVLYDDILAYGDAENIGELISFSSDVESEMLVDLNPKSRRKKVDKKERCAETRGRKKKDTRPIECYTLLGEYICTYPSVMDASEATGLFASAIRACIKKQNKRAGDFVFRYEGNELDLPHFGEMTLNKHIVKK